MRLPRFFQFEVNEEGTDYHTSKMFEDSQYISISAYWDDLFVTGIMPIFMVAFLNLKTYLSVRIQGNLLVQKLCIKKKYSFYDLLS